MIILLVALLPTLVILNMAFYEYRVIKPVKDDNITYKYSKLILNRRYG